MPNVQQWTPSMECHAVLWCIIEKYALARPDFQSAIFLPCTPNLVTRLTLELTKPHIVVLRATNQLVLLICPKHNPMAICDGQYASVTYKPLISSGVSRQNVRTCRAPIVRPLASWTELTGELCLVLSYRIFPHSL